MTTLDVPGARLYYETRGTGPLLVMIPGANGDARVFTAVGEQLAQYHTVVTYDRRGFSRSPLTGPQDYEHRLETDADDVHRLINHLGTTTADVFGTSSGAVVALTVLNRHPSSVHTLAAYEPAANSLLPDSQQWLDLNERLYQLYRDQGVVAALEAFREHVMSPGDRHFLSQAPDLGGEHLHANATYWFERELRYYPMTELDIDALRRRADQIVLLAGAESRGYPAHQVNVELGRILGHSVLETPGGHLATATHPTELADTLRRALRSHNVTDPSQT